MKSTFVRVAVVTLAFVGFGASSISAKIVAAGKKPVVVSMTPMPGCMPNGGGGARCGLE